MEEVKDAVKKELEGPGRRLGYRAMHKKVRQEYNLHVTRNAVYNVIYDLDPEGLEARGGIGAKKKRKKGNFSSKVTFFEHPPCWTWIPQSILGLFGSPRPCGSGRPQTNFFCNRQGKKS